MKKLFLLALATFGLAIVGVVAAQAITEEAEVTVRVNAQRHSDGRTEFAIQYRTEGGSWSERQLPRGRFLPARPPVDRWLNSTPINFDVPVEIIQEGTDFVDLTIELKGDGDARRKIDLLEGDYLIEVRAWDESFEYGTSVSADLDVNMFDTEQNKRSWSLWAWNSSEADTPRVFDRELDLMYVDEEQNRYLAPGEMEFIVNAEDDENWTITITRIP